MNTALKKAMLGLEGLSTGDAFGEWFIRHSHFEKIRSKELPDGPWEWTDDTAMAIGIVDVLSRYSNIDQDALAATFAKNYEREPFRGYGRGAASLLSEVQSGKNWEVLSPALFGGGSFGNGSAMRVAPLGAYFYDDQQMVILEAEKSAQITHYHPEGVAGAIAVALAASFAANKNEYTRDEFIENIHDLLPESEVKHKIKLSLSFDSGHTSKAALKLGSGMNVSAQDTVPFCIWCAANNLNDYEAALWQTVEGFGDMDTTCAIVGGIVALSCGGVSKRFLERREVLPEIC